MKAIPRFRLKEALSALLLAWSLCLGLTARAQSTDELLTALQKSSLPREGASIDPRLTQSVEALRKGLALGRLADAAQYLTSMKSMFAGNDAAVAVIDQLQLTIRTQMAADDARRDSAIDKILEDATAKFLARAPASDFDLLLKRLASIPLPQALQTQYNDPTGQKIESARGFVAGCQDYLLQSDASNIEQADNALNQLIQISSRLTVVPRSQLVALKTDLAKRSSGANEVALARWEALKKRVGATIDSAKSAADFDPVLLEIGKTLSTDSNRGNNSLYMLNSQIDVLRRFTRHWQDYYSHVESGNTNAAQNSLRELANENSFESFYPRSRILARLSGKLVSVETPVPGETLIAPDAVTIETLEEFARQTAVNQATNSLGMRDSTSSDLANEAARLRTAAIQLKLGNPLPAISLMKFQNGATRLGAYALACAHVQQALVLRGLPLYIRAPSDLKVSENETPDAYLQRVIQRAAQTKDWQLVYRALEANQNFVAQVSSVGVGSSELDGYRFFFIGMNHERAGEWTSAARSYLTALRTGGVSLPAEEIGHHLTALREAHPKDYETAENQPFLPNPTPNLPPGMFPGRFPPNGNMPGANWPPQMGNPNPRAFPGQGNPLSAPPPPPELEANQPATPAMPQEKPVSPSTKK